MNGADAGDITTAVSGTYNDVTGVLDVTVTSWIPKTTMAP